MKVTIIVEESEPGELADNTQQEIVELFYDDPPSLFDGATWDIRGAKE